MSSLHTSPQPYEEAEGRTVQALATPINPMNLKDIYSCFPTGVIALCGVEINEPIGISASSFTSISLEPALVSVSIQKSSTTWPRLRQLPKLGISILSENQTDICRALAGKGDRFAHIDWEPSPYGALYIRDAAAGFECSIVQEIEAGDHIIVLFRIESMWSDHSLAPLVFHRGQLRPLQEI